MGMTGWMLLAGLTVAAIVCGAVWACAGAVSDYADDTHPETDPADVR